VHLNVSDFRLIASGKDSEQRALSSPVAADQSDTLATVDAKRQVGE
jgi:hypothetical protein